MSNYNDALRRYLADNPRMTGVLFAVLLALTQAGNVAAASGGTTA